MQPLEFKSSIINKIKLKEEQGEFYCEGFVATDHVDDSLDLLPVSTLTDMVTQINSSSKSNKASIHHDRDDKTVIGKATHAELKQTEVFLVRQLYNFRSGLLPTYISPHLPSFHQQSVSLDSAIRLSAIAPSP